MDLGSVVIVDGDDELPNFVLPRVDVVEGYLLRGHSRLCMTETESKITFNFNVGGFVLSQNYMAAHTAFFMF